MRVVLSRTKYLQASLKDAEGIGTSATRAEILEKLITIGMMAREKKSFVATQFGIDVIDSLQGHDVVSPVLTAVWSKKLKDIIDGIAIFRGILSGHAYLY